MGVALEQGKLRAKTIVDGFNIIGCDVMNVGEKDLAGGLELLRSFQDSSKFPFISSNIIYKDSRERVFDSTIILKRGAVSIGVMGLCTKLPAAAEELDILNPVETGIEIMEELAENSDFQIVLLNGTDEEVKEMKKELPAADFIFLSGSTRGPRLTAGKNNDPGIYMLGKQGKSLGVLTLNIAAPDEAFEDISHHKNRRKFIRHQIERLQNKDPSKPLEEIYKDNPRTLERILKLKADLASVDLEEKGIEGKNTQEYEFVSMSKTMKDDHVLLVMVEETLSACDRLSGTTDKPRVKLHPNPKTSVKFDPSKFSKTKTPGS